MKSRARKLVGSILLVLFLFAYALIAMSIGSGRIAEAQHPAQALYFLAAGLLWVLPAGLLVRWMQRPDPD